MPRYPARLACLFVAASCAGGPQARPDAPEPAIASPTSAMLPPGTVHRTSRAGAFDAMIEELADADVVAVGEVHGDARHHTLQLRVLEQLYARGRLHAIGMEMFQRPFQDALDAYSVHATLDEPGLRERTEWDRRWGHPWDAYAPILRFARAKRLPILALSPARETVKAVADGGLAALSDEERRALPALDPSRDPEGYRPFLRRWYGEHAHGEAEPDPEGFDRFVLAMRLRDEVMAGTVAAWFRDAAPEDAQMLVLAGVGHLAHRWGIPARVERRMGGTTRVVVPVARAEAERDRAVFARAHADWIWILPDGAEAGR